MSNLFSAGSSAIGYLYQVRYALYLILNKIELDISIEHLDDVAFEREGKALELLQLKHHISQKANLTDSSTDLWKTIRVWSEGIKSNEVNVSSVIFSLVTTSTANDSSIAASLKDNQDRDPTVAWNKLVQVAKKSNNESNRSSYDSFLSLPNDKQLALVENIYILDKSDTITTVIAKIKKRLILSARKEHLDLLYERLEGWWFDKIIYHLVNSSKCVISGKEVHHKIQEINEQFRTDSLPIDYQNAKTENDVEINDEQLFIQQLKVITVSPNRVKQAKKDYYRSAKQRSRWIGDDLVSIDELTNYESRLQEEWSEHYEMVNEDFQDDEDINEESLKKRGKILYNQFMQLSYLTIRKNCTEPYVMRGSVHMLANKSHLILGWHPCFKELFGYSINKK